MVLATMGISPETIVGILAILVAAPPAIFAMIKFIRRRRVVSSRQALEYQRNLRVCKFDAVLLSTCSLIKSSHTVGSRKRAPLHLWSLVPSVSFDAFSSHQYSTERSMSDMVEYQDLDQILGGTVA